MEKLKEIPSVKLLQILVLLISITILPACEEKQDPLFQLKSTLIGTWQAIPTEEYKPFRDLFIEFKANNTIDKHPTFLGDIYTLISETSLDVRWEDGRGGYTYEISFNKNGTITIYNFEDASITQIEKNITFKKIK